LIVEQITVGPFQENCYLVSDTDSDSMVIVDPGDEAERIIAAVEKSGKTPEAIWITHGHVDHVGAIAAIKRRWDIPVYLHPLDERLYRAAGRQAEIYGVPFEEPPPADRELEEGQVMKVGNLELTVSHVPGHAPGHVMFYGEGNAIVGDCLFAGSIGRTDLPFCNPSHLDASLKRIVALPDATVVHSGHGEITTIGREKISNPFINGTARIVGA
jgi:glyoxylase-like metal-dependent hydrolase (beta-lactamase superfamily II)